MDKNQATGLILIALLVLLYFQFFAPEPPLPEETVTTEQPINNNSSTKDSPVLSPSTTTLSDSAQAAIANQKYGVFAVGSVGEQKNIRLENEKVIIDFDTKGGQVSQVELKDFKTYLQEPLILFNAESSDVEQVVNSLGRSIDLTELFYTSSRRNIGDTTVLTFTLAIATGQQVKHIYKLPKDGYELQYELKLEGLESYLNKDDIVYRWNNHLIPQENDISQSRINTTVNYYTISEDFDGLSERSNSYEEETLNEPLKWIAIKQRFFISGIIADNSFSKAKLAIDVNQADSSEVKFAQVELGIPYGDVVSSKGKFKYYFGPNDYYVTSDVADEFSRNLYLGWPPMKWVNKYVLIPLFAFLSRFISNYGVIIIIMVLLIKLVLSPLSYKSYLSMAKMKVLKPELDEIKEKHGGDAAKAQQEQMKLYSKVGVNPISGCIPVVLQMPILLSMFYFFPQSIELRQESFLWAHDLSTYDSIATLPFSIPFYGNHVSLFVILMTVTTILYTWQNQQVSTVQGPMKSLSYMMPIIFMFVLNSYPAALSFYYFISTLVTFLQQAVIRKFVDEDKIKLILEENKKKNVNKKKSKFQQRLEDAMKAKDQAKPLPKGKPKKK